MSFSIQISFFSFYSTGLKRIGATLLPNIENDQKSAIRYSAHRLHDGRLEAREELDRQVRDDLRIVSFE